MKPRTSIIWIVLFFFLVKAIPVFSQQIIFNKVLPPEGKSFDMVAGITQDINGYMWFATKNGLYSYDGYRMTSYKNDRLNKNSIGINILESIFADSNGIIWVGTLGSGLDRFDPENKIFTHFHHDANDPTSLSNDTVTAILRDKSGILWIGTHGGLDQLEPKTNKFLHSRYNANDLTSISNNQVRAIYEDRQGTIWIGTGSAMPDDGGRPEEGGLNSMNRKSGTFTRYLHDPNNVHSLSNNKVRAIFEDNIGNFWIGTKGNGLHKMDRQRGTFERIANDPAHPEKLCGPPLTKESSVNEHITFITQDAAKSYWVGTLDGGLNYYNPKIGKTIHYKGIENPSKGFNDPGVWTAFTSRDGIFWISSNWNSGNLYRIDPFNNGIQHTISSRISGFYEEPNGIFWTVGDEIIRNDRNKEITKRFKNINPVYEWMFFIKGDRQGNIWVGTSGGLKLWNKEKDIFITYKNEPGHKNNFSDNEISSIYEDSDSNLWIATKFGLTLRNPRTGLFTQYFINYNDIAEWENATNKSISAILKDKTGKLWLGTSDGIRGVLQFNLESKKIKNYLKGIRVGCMYEDYDGSLWLGCEDGLYTFNQTSDAFIRYKDSSSFSEIPDVSFIVEDNEKFLWLQTSIGMMRLNPQRNKTMNYGISKTPFNFNNSGYKGRDGKLYFTESGGYYSFYPADFTQDIKPPEIIFTGFRLANKLILPGNEGPLIESLSKVKEIRLRYNQNAFAFEFAAIDYTNPIENQHQFMLESYDENWRHTGSDLKASYYNIPPGKYVFRVKAANSKGAWAEKKINIIILPPWWGTWWANCMYGLFVATTVVAAFRFQKQRIVLAERQKTQIRELAHAQEIEKAYTELKSTQVQLIQTEKMASLGELTAGIAHEIQNPLNFINNFSEVNKELIGELQQEAEKGNINEVKSLASDIEDNDEKIIHHSKRADAIVKSMLQHSRTSSGKKELTNINALADEYLKLAYHGMRAKDKTFNVTLQTDFDDSAEKINIIPQDIGRVLLNLYNNAFYAVSEKMKVPDENYEPKVTVSTHLGTAPENVIQSADAVLIRQSLTVGRQGANSIIISVKDNGTGIPDKVKEKIFQPFFTTKPAGKGMGLGLSLSYDIVKAHGGEIKVESKEGEGSEFSILLPVK